MAKGAVVRERARSNILRCLICPQLTAVNSVVFTVKAVDADGDTITYVIDQSSVGPPRRNV